MYRKKYNKEFKLAAVKLVLEDDMPVAVVAKELSIHYNSLYRWISEFEEFGDNAFPGNGSVIHSYQYKIKKLQQENLQLQQELDMLKKFRAFLKKKNL